jgi:hypothetical protein
MQFAWWLHSLSGFSSSNSVNRNPKNGAVHRLVGLRLIAQL